MSCINSARRQFLQESLAKKQAQLEKAYTSFDDLLSDNIEEYRFDSNEGAQRARRRKIIDLKQIIDALEGEIEQILRKLECAGIVNLNLRRKRYAALYPGYF